MRKIKLETHLEEIALESEALSIGDELQVNLRVANVGKDGDSLGAALEPPHPCSSAAMDFGDLCLLSFIVRNELLLVESHSNDIRPKKCQLGTEEAMEEGSSV